MASKGSIEAGRGHVTLGVQSDPLTKGLQAASAQFQSWGKGLAVMGAGISAAGAAITAPFLYGLSVLAEWGGSVLRASRQTGLSFEGVQSAALRMSTDMDGVTASVNHMNAFLGEVAHGSGEAGNALRELGLDATAMLGPMSQDERLRQFGEAIASIGDAAQRGAAARRIFGRGAIDMNFSGGVEGMRAREARGRELGGVLSPADLAAAGQYTRAQKEMGMATKGLWASIGAAAAPAMAEFFNLITKVVVAVRVWTQENRPLLDTIFRIADKVALAGAALVALGSAVYGVSYAFQFVSGAIAIVKGGLAALWGFTTLAAGGFGLATAAGWVYAGAMLAWTGVVWLYNAAGLVGHFITYGWIAALVALGVAIVAVQVALGLGVIAIVAYGVYMLATSDFVQTAWRKIVGAFRVGASLAADAIGWLSDKINAVLDYISGSFLGEAWRYWAGVAQTGINAVIGLLSRMAGVISGAVSQTVDNLTSLFSGLVGTATTSFGAIKDAFAVNDWMMIWEIVKISAQLAWVQIVAFIEPTFNLWKDAISDTFNLAWDGVKTGFIRIWSEIKAIALEGLAVIATATASITPAGSLRDLLTAQATSFTLDARLTRDNATRQINAVGQEAADRDYETDWLRAFRDNEAEQGNTAEVARLQGELDYLAAEAETARIVADLGRQVPSDVASPGEGFGAAANRGMIIGSFSNAALFGALGTTSREVSPLQRIADLTGESLIVARRANQLLQEVERAAGARCS